ncbi:MAG TPA: DUF3108 domain-containing protein [Bryobacteraceae bacterium]|nr:DUF3108 domain-containing protein [Bryobacteraceae bacterium]
MRPFLIDALAAAVFASGMAPDSSVVQEQRLTDKHRLQYGIEWRLVRAGVARVDWQPKHDGGYQANLHLESAGLVSKLYRVNDKYTVALDKALCAENFLLQAEEGKRRRETKVTFGKGKLNYLERDLLKNTVVLAKELQTAPCVHEYMGALNKLRGMQIALGQSVQVPMTDGKKFAMVKVDAQEREVVKTPVGSFNAIRYEIHMFNEVIINRKARMHVWVSDDPRRLPVQVRVRMNVLTGTITLQLEKME